MPEAESFDLHDYVPDVGGFRLRDSPSSEARSLLDITSGRFSLHGRSIRDTQTNRFIGSLSANDQTHLSVGTMGTIMLHNVVSKDRLQASMGTKAIPSAQIVGNLAALGIGEGVDINRFITLAPRGSVLYVNDSIPSGKARYTRVDTAVYGDMSPPLVNDLGRLATSDQLLARGVAGWIARNAAAALDRLKLSGYTLSDGKTTTSGSEIVRAIAANITVTPLVTYLLTEAP